MAAAPQPAAIGFSSSEVHAFKPGIAWLRLADLNRDGRADIVFSNRREGRLEILLRRPAAAGDEEMPRREQVFDVRSTIANQDVEALELACLDGPDRKDILIFGRPLGLQRIRIDQQGAPQPPEDIFLEALDEVRAMDTGDLNGDGRPEIVIFREKAIDLLWNDGTADLPRRTALPMAEERTAWGRIADADGDGHRDLLCFLKSTGVPVVVLRGDGKGGFGPELPVQYGRGMSEELLLDVDNPGPRICTTIGGGTSLRLLRFATDRGAELFTKASCSAPRLCLRGAGKDAPPWLAADVNADGFDDLLVAAPELSALHLYRGGPDGLALPPETIDSLADIASLARFAGGGLLVVSRTEKRAARHAADRLKRFPAMVPLPGDALVCAAMGDAGYIVCRQGETHRLMQIREDGTQVADVELEGVLNDPCRALAMALPDGSCGLLLFAEFAEPRMFRISGGVASPIEPAAFSVLGQPLRPEHVGIVSEGGTNRIVVCANRTARAYAWTEDRFEVVRQYNPEERQATLVGACAFTRNAGDSGLLTFDSGSRDLLWFGTNSAPLRLHLSSEVGTVTGLAPLATPAGMRVAVMAANAVHLLAPQAPMLEMAVHADYQSPSRDPRLVHAFAVRAGRNRPLVAAVDGANHTLELLERVEDALVNRLTFKVFDAPFSVSERSQGMMHEPHDVASGDINGDGIADLALLCQDRLLLYFGE